MEHSVKPRRTALAEPCCRLQQAVRTQALADEEWERFDKTSGKPRSLQRAARRRHNRGASPDAHTRQLRTTQTAFSARCGQRAAARSGASNRCAAFAATQRAAPRQPPPMFMQRQWPHPRYGVHGLVLPACWYCGYITVSNHLGSIPCYSYR
jgi:hypothetical protein